MSDSSIKAIFQALNAACQGQLSLSEAVGTLEAQGAFEFSGRENPIARYSQSIIDALPKIFRGQASTDTLAEQLQQKLNSHSLLLQTLSDAGILLKLQPTSLRCLFEDSQKARAVLALLNMEASIVAQGIASPLSDLSKATGEKCGRHVQIGGDKPLDEVVYFYSAPTVTTTSFFAEVAASVNALSSVGTPQQKLERISIVVDAVQAALDAAQQEKATYQQYYSTPFLTAIAGVDAPEWSSDVAVRAALDVVGASLIRLLSVSDDVNTAHNVATLNLLFVVAERALNAYAAALAAVRGLERVELGNKYADVRDTFLNPLLSATLELWRAGENEAEDRMQRLESLAECHNGYRQLFDICDFLEDRQRLQMHMRHLGGDDLTGSMTIYVFSRLLEERRYSEILTLDADFNQDLAVWLRGQDRLQDKLNIRWLHDIREQEFAAAAESLADVLGQSVQDANDANYYSALQRLANFCATD